MVGVRAASEPNGASREFRGVREKEGGYQYKENKALAQYWRGFEPF